MDVDAFFKKVYTTAFRLTGEEKAACNIAMNAIERIAKKMNIHRIVPSNMLKLTIKEVCKIFLEEHHVKTSDVSEYTLYTLEETKNELNELQEAILTLEPINRVTIIWRDILGFKLSEIIPAVNRTEKELYQELLTAHKQLKEKIYMAGMLN